METLARRLSRSPRTIQRHLHLLKEKGLIEFVERKRDWHGRFGAYVYRVLHIAAATARKGAQQAANSRKERRRKKRPTTGHGGHVASNKRQTKRHEDPSNLPIKDLKSGFWWLFGEEAPPGAEKEYQREAQNKRVEEAQRRREGYQWFFK